MGRSQVKYRATHGRGRGRGRGDTTGGRGEVSERRQPRHLRNLGSNAYRFEERESQEGAGEGGDISAKNYGGRTQFFASNQNYRENMGAAPGEYFQSSTMKQWEEKDDDAEAALGVLDLDWIASQLQLVSPDIRYRMDVKYCVDLPFEAPNEVEDESKGEIAEETSAAPSKPAQGDTELDFLLNLSASTSSGVKSTPTPSIPAVSAPAPTKIPAETEQLEEWLDDVLDM
ncbi:hypothetical protein V7S43_012013 [Phytophthora oleae]|uniref:Cell death regulator Aven n=1 Tax=Phytophthora oleae TaxID=2107226 RepID=A0ABD3F8M9_9STRA